MKFADIYTFIKKYIYNWSVYKLKLKKYACIYFGFCYSGHIFFKLDVIKNRVEHRHKNKRKYCCK